MSVHTKILSTIARQGGGKLLDSALSKLVQGQKVTRGKNSVIEAIAGAALTRIATRSVPGAILIGGGLIAKSLYDRRKAQQLETDKNDMPESAAGNADDQ